MTNENLYCCVDPPFPMSGFVVTLPVTKQDGSRAMYPFDLVYTSVSEMAGDIGILRQELMQQGNIYRIPDPCFVQPVLYIRRYPLRREFWEHPEETFAADARMDVMLQAMDKPDLFMLLVTPTKVQKQWRFSAALPMPVSTPDRVIEQFMLHSDWPVAEEAKYAALYRIGGVRMFDWKQKKMVEKTRFRPAKATVH